ncbi:MAG: ATP synthase F0 subunit B [Acidobacteria bacterium]|nr:ATP synthase F0 subunit B [Acidobacteriota bacterium]
MTKTIIGICLISVPALASGGEGGISEGALLAAKAVNFLIFVGILVYFLRDAVRNFFVSRLAHIKESLELAERSRQEAKRRLDEIEEKMGNLDQELEAIERTARDDAEREKQRIQDQAAREAERIIEQARSEVENMKRHAIGELRKHILELAFAQAEQDLEGVAAKDKNRVFDDFTAKLGAKP